MKEILNNSAERFKTTSIDLSFPDVSYMDQKHSIFQEKKNLNGINYQDIMKLNMKRKSR